VRGVFIARKLKTYQTSLGFFDLAIAAPSMKAALEAWGADSNLFHQGAASRRAKPGAYLAYDGNSGLVTEAERFRRWSASCAHYPNVAVGDMTFDIRKMTASDLRSYRWVDRIMRSVRKWTAQSSERTMRYPRIRDACQFVRGL
jgi:hypothetical protein